MNKIILIGGGGHCKVVISTAKLLKNYEIYGIIDIAEKTGKFIENIPIIGTDNDLEKYYNEGIKHCIITAGSVGKMDLRINLFKKAERIGFKFINIIHPTSIISDNIRIGLGNFISAGTIINTETIIGNNCIINTGSIIEHNCRIGDNVHIATGAVVSGGVEIGNNVHIGAGSSLKQYIKIGNNTIIGLGSNVIKSIPSNKVAYGNPCKEVV